MIAITIKYFLLILTLLNDMNELNYYFLQQKFIIFSSKNCKNNFNTFVNLQQNFV